MDIAHRPSSYVLYQCTYLEEGLKIEFTPETRLRIRRETRGSTAVCCSFDTLCTRSITQSLDMLGLTWEVEPVNVFGRALDSMYIHQTQSCKMRACFGQPFHHLGDHTW